MINIGTHVRTTFGEYGEVLDIHSSLAWVMLDGGGCVLRTFHELEPIGSSLEAALLQAGINPRYLGVTPRQVENGEWV